MGVTDDSNAEIRNLLVDPVTGRLKISANIQGDNVIATALSVDAMTTGANTIYTVPTGYVYVFTNAIIAVSAADSITEGATISIGTNATWDNIVPDTALGLVTAGQYGLVGLPAGTTTGASIATASSVVSINIDTAATGTSQSLYVYLFGFLVAV